jgi:hypothetical protein
MKLLSYGAGDRKPYGRQENLLEAISGEMSAPCLRFRGRTRLHCRPGMTTQPETLILCRNLVACDRGELVAKPTGLRISRRFQRNGG